MRSFIIVFLLLGPTLALAADEVGRSNTPQQGAKSSLTVTSSAFAMDAAIPSKYTCDGADVSPPLAWSDVPSGIKSIAILVEDPDAPGGSFTHWLITGIGPTQRSLAEAAVLPDGAMTAKNDKGTMGYTGPCPPSGMHHYHFHVYALDFALGRSYTRADFLASIASHVIAEGDLVGTYRRP